jgi:hypothetical protein
MVANDASMAAIAQLAAVGRDYHSGIEAGFAAFQQEFKAMALRGIVAGRQSSIRLIEGRR